MIKTPANLRHFLRSTALGGLAAFVFCPLAAQAFNPNDVPPSATSASVTLPSTDALLDTETQATLVKSGKKPAPVQAATSLVYPAANPAIEALAAPLANAQPAPVPAPAISAAPAATATIAKPVYPPVDAATQATAARIMNAPAPSAVAIAPRATPPSAGFIAPAPLLQVTPTPAVTAPKPTTPAPAAPVSVARAAVPQRITAPAPAGVAIAPAALPPIPALQPIPIAVAPIAATTPIPPARTALSDETQRVLSHVPSKMDADTSKAGKFSVSRVSPAVQTLPDKTSKVETYDAVGLSIKVKRPGLDTNFELNRAYTALMGGETSQAIEIYKNILSSEPANQDALFGLAATYQRVGERTTARSYYGKLLEVNPDHRAGINNFLALVSEESPEGSLAELERLEQRNPNFSAIPAQQALVLKKLGYDDRAREKMIRAIELSPENIAYKYNLAVLLDGSGHTPEAIALYRQLIGAALKGERMPATLETLQKRLNFLVTSTTASAPAPR